MSFFKMVNHMFVRTSLVLVVVGLLSLGTSAQSKLPKLVMKIHRITEYAVSNTEPADDSSAWKPLTKNSSEGNVTVFLPSGSMLWYRAAAYAGSKQPDMLHWYVYGPLRGSFIQVDWFGPTPQFTSIDPPAETTPVASPKTLASKSAACCRIKIRVRVVVRPPPPPRVTVSTNVTVRWRGPVPQVTSHGPDVDFDHLPRITWDPLKDAESKIPVDGPVPDKLGMRCEERAGEAFLFVQNGDPYDADVWIFWKIEELGPIRVGSMTERKLGGTGLATCALANESIYITHAIATH